MSNQVDYAIESMEKLTKLIRTSWGSGYIIRPEMEQEVEEAKANMETEIAAIDPLSLDPQDETRLRRAKEEHLVRTNPEIEREEDGRWTRSVNVLIH